jgi:flagellar hook assembly protein FlgD
VWPNPFNPSAQIGFSVGSDNLPLRINVYNLRGQKVITLADQSYSRGSHSVCWDGRDAHGKPVSSGVYIIELQSPGIRMSTKAVLAK